MKKIVLLWSLLALTACEKTAEIMNRPVRVELLSVVLRNNTSVEVEGRANGANGAEFGVVYGLKPLPTLADNRQPKGQINKAYQEFVVDIEALTTGQRYYFRTYVKENEEIKYSSQIELIITLPRVWRRLNRIDISNDYQPLPEILADGNANTLTVYFRTPDSEALEAIAGRIEIGDEFSFWSGITAPRPALLNYQRFYLRYADGNRELFQGLGYQYNPQLPNPYQFSRIFIGEPPPGRGRLPDYPGADAPVALFHFNNVAYFLEKGGNYQLWFYDNDAPSRGFQQRAALPVKSGTDFQAFSINNKGYIIAEGNPVGNPVRVFEYDPARDQWNAKASFTGESRTKGTAWARGKLGYYGMGQATGRVAGLKDIWQYDPATDRWTAVAEYPGGGNVGLGVAVMNGQVYLGFGYRAVASAAGAFQYAPRYDLWQVRL